MKESIAFAKNHSQKYERPPINVHIGVVILLGATVPRIMLVPPHFRVAVPLGAVPVVVTKRDRGADQCHPEGRYAGSGR
jgi:hypothetical protein